MGKVRTLICPNEKQISIELQERGYYLLAETIRVAV